MKMVDCIFDFDLDRDMDRWNRLLDVCLFWIYVLYAFGKLVIYYRKQPPDKRPGSYGWEPPVLGKSITLFDIAAQIFSRKHT